MYHTQQAVAIGNQHTGDMARLHQVQRIDGKNTGANANAARRHDVSDTGITHIDTGIKYPAQVAIGENTDDVHVIITDSRHA